MSEYINKRDVIRAFTFNYKGERIPETDVDNFPIQIPVREVKKIIREILPADVVPVVQCKDCVYWSSKDTRYCNMLQGTFQENDFCSHGKRKGADE